MKEKKEVELKELLFNDITKNVDKNKHINKEIELNIFNHQKQKSEKYKLLNEKDELLLYKEEMINEIKENKPEEIKIKDLYNGKDTDSIFYINKNEIKKKILNNATDFETEFCNSSIDNENKEEMEKLYKEVQLKHPRKIIEGQIKKYPFFSWSGFFCCNKKDYISLGLGITNYLNTLKLMIIFFFIISFINLSSVIVYKKYNSIYDFNDNSLLKTTIGNTIELYFNSNYIIIPNNTVEDSSLYITMDCGKNYIEDNIIMIRYYFTEDYSHIVKNSVGVQKEFFYYDPYFQEDSEFIKFDYFYIGYNDLYGFHSYQKCKYKNYCTIQYYQTLNNLSYNSIDIIYYSCNKKNNIYLPGGNGKINEADNKDNLLENIVLIIPLVTLIIIIIFYFTYKKSISKDNKKYHNNKILINRYTLVLQNLKISSDDYNQDLSDLISFLDNIIKEYKYLLIQNQETFRDINEHNIFDISISNVNQKKIDIFNEIKTLQTQIDDIKNDNDSIEKKVKNKIHGLYHSLDNIVTNLTNKDGKEKIEDNTKKDDEHIDNSTYEEKQIKIDDKKNKINDKINTIIYEIVKMHKEYNLNNYVDIYITFRNQLISNLIYKIYKKNKLIRLFYYIFCQANKIKKYYYKNQWLNFRLAIESPEDIQWENCYISKGKKIGRRCFSIIISLLFIILITNIIMFIKILLDNEISSFLITLLIQIINVFSSNVLGLLTKIEKHSSKSKNIFSNISKFYWFNFLLSGYFVLLDFKINIFMIPFTYLGLESYFVQNKIIIENMIWSILTSQISPIVFYFYNLLKKYIDSKYNNGKTTELKDKKSYEKIYLGPEFPFTERYSKLFLNLSICFLYGVTSPVIFFFFLIFLIVTFLVDKYLIINYYKKSQYYGKFLSTRATNYIAWGLYLYFFGLIFNLSNPYLLNNKLLKEYFNPQTYSLLFIEIIYCIINPWIIFLFLVMIIFNFNFLFYNFNYSILFNIFIFIIFFFNPKSIIEKKFYPKNNIHSFLNVSPIEIGNIYSIDVLKKFYEIKKLQLFDLIIDCEKNNKDKNDYSNLINNYIQVIKYLKKYIDNREDKKNIISFDDENAENENSSLKVENIFNSSQFHISGDISYNQSFIPNYEIYQNFSLIKNFNE